VLDRSTVVKMRGIGVFAGLLRSSGRLASVDASVVASVTSSSSYDATKHSVTAIGSLINRSYSSSSFLNRRNERYDKSIKKWDVSGKGFDQFVEKKEKIEDVTLTGRSWTPAELRRKSFDDLHKLWFVLYKERNMLLSEREKIKRMNRPIIPMEETRYIKVKRSMGAIKFVLNERSKIKKTLEYENIITELALELKEGQTEGAGGSSSSTDANANADAGKGGKTVPAPAVRILADTKPGGVSW
jgi:hypothetical protein